jgi:hypothetical protein
LKREGSTEASKRARQERVYGLVIRRFKTAEIARQENVDERTIQRDVQEIKFALMQDVPRQQLRTLTLASAELNEIWRELWILYYRVPREIPVKHDKEVDMRKEDDRPIKMMILAQLAKISDKKNRLVFQTPAPIVTQNRPPVDSKNPDQVVRSLVNSLPEPQRRSLLETLERQTSISKENT